MTSRKIRVLFAIPALDRGGPDRVMFELMKALDRTQFSPILMVSEPTGHYLSQLPADIPVEVLGHEDSLQTRYPFLRALRVVRRHDPDVVFSTLRMNTTLGLISPAFRRRTRLVLRQANDFTTDFTLLMHQSLLKHRVARWLAVVTLRVADAVVCQSHTMQKDLGDVLGDSAKLHVIGNPVDMDAVTRSASAVEATLPGHPALVSAGRLMSQKGYDILLPAIAVIRERYPRLHLTIFGEGPDREALEAQSRDLGLEKLVTFAGFSAQVLPHIKAADLFVLASRYEGFPNAALEALACGTPLVLTDCPGANSEIVLPGVNGRLAADIDAHSFANALDTALGELESYNRATIKSDCQQRYGSQRIVAEYERVLSSVVEA